MTEPVDPQEQFLARMRLVFDQDYGTKFRPGLAETFATSDASPADMARIGAFVRAIDTEKATRLAAASGAIERSTGEQQDLLNAAGAGHHAVKVAKYEQAASADTDLPWWEDVWNAAQKFSIYSFDGDHPDGLLNDKIEPALDALAKVPGFLYRTARSATYGTLNGPDDSLGVPTKAKAEMAQRDADKAAQGYGTDVWDDIAFNWNQGESTFHDLQPVRDRYGDADVDLALEIYRTGWQSDDTLAAYRQQIEADFAAGDISLSEAAAKIQRIEDPEFVNGAYEAVNRKHVSLGRDLARAVLPDDQEDTGWFTSISGTTDALFTLFIDPAIVGGKVYKSAQFARWGLDSVNSSKIYHMLGEFDPVTQTAAPSRYVRNNVRRAGVESFLKARAAYDEAMAGGKAADAEVIFAGARQRHRDLMPLWSEVGGVRPAVTAAEREAAEKSGITVVDANGVSLPGVQAAPIRTVQEFADYAVNHWGLMRLANGLPSRERMLLPGRVGYWAERKAVRAEKRQRNGLDRAADEGATVINFEDANLTRIIGDEAEDKMQEAARLRGEQLFEQANAAELSARKLRTKIEAMNRRLSTFLPTSRELRLNSAADSANVIRFARIFMEKWEAERFGAMWEHANPAGRRTLAKALLVQTFEASGLTRSVVGREMVDKYINDLEKLNARRYGYGDSDLIGESWRGPFRGGLYESQIQQTITLPAFTELRRLAAKAAVAGYDPGLSKFGLDAASARRLAMGKGQKIPRLGTTALRYWLFSSTVADRLMQAVKLGWIANPANMLRNALDEFGLLALTGQAGRLSKGRALMHGAGLSSSLAKSGETGKFAALVWNSIPKDLRAGLKSTRDVTRAINVGRLRLMGRRVTEDDVRRAGELHERTLAAEVDEYLGGRIIDNPDEATGLGHEYAREAHERGVPLSRFELKGYDVVDRDGANGLTALADYYGQRFVGDSPAKATLAWMMWREAERNPEFLEKLDVATIEAMQDALPVDNGSYFAALRVADPNYAHAAGLTDDELELFNSAEAIYAPDAGMLVDELGKDRYARMRRELELFNIDTAGNKIDPADAKGLELARIRMAPRYLTDVTMGVTGRNGKVNPELASMLVRGDIPDVTELKAMGDDLLPPTAIKAQYGVPSGGPVNGVLDGYTALAARAYDFLVTRPIRALVRTPLYVDMYVTARKQTELMEQDFIKNHGWDKAVAKEYAIATAEKQALNQVIKFVDNPKVASQFSAMSRNWWTFFRAQEDWIRRYGRALSADPVAIRKAHMAVISAQEAGFLDRDADGNLIFTYPGSGAVTEGFLHFGAFLGWHDPALIPNVPDLSTRLTFLNPSLNNPFGYSATPLVSIPWRMFATLTPGNELFDKEMDRLINGELGAGRSWYEQMLPTPITRLIQLTGGDKDNTGSFVGSAVATAMTNLALNGTLEKYADTPQDRARAIADLQTQTLNVLALRSIFAFAAPGAPGMPSIGEDEAGEADLSYQQAGIMSLKAEFQNMVARLGPGPAYQLWAELHPEASVFMDARRTESAPGARTQATSGAAAYVLANRDFFTGKYASIAPYFIPEAPGEFSPVAWRALTELGIRQYRDLDDVFLDLVTSNGVTEYYRNKDVADAAIADARRRGDRARVKELQEQWKVKRDEMHVRYPTLDDYFTQGSARTRARIDAIERLEELIADPKAPAQVQPQLAGLTDMVRVYREYEAQHAAFGAARSTQVTAEKQNLAASYHDTMRTIIKQYPSIEDAYNGIFRSLVDEVE